MARDMTEQKRVEEQLMLLLRASASLLASTPETVVESIIRLAQEFVAADAYAVWRKSSPDLVWRIAWSEGLSAENERVMEHGGEGPDRTVAVEDVLAADYLRERAESYRKEGIRSLVAAPLRSAEGVNGTLVFYYRAPHHFSAAEITICTALGNLGGGSPRNRPFVS